MNNSHTNPLDLKKQCEKFLDNNNMKMAVVEICSEYGDMEVEGHAIYLIPKDSNYFLSSDIRKHGVFIQRV